MKGKLYYYEATGEIPRPQFIGDNSIDKKGKIKNYKEVYDIDTGDVITFLDKNFYNDVYTINLGQLCFLTYLSRYYKKPLEIEYTPHIQHKSWKEYTREYNRKNKNIIKK